MEVHAGELAPMERLKLLQHDSHARHDMWSRTISRNKDSGTPPCVKLQRRPMRTASKIAARRAGKIVLALRWPAGKEGAGESLRGSGAAVQHAGSRTDQGQPSHAAEEKMALAWA